MGQLLTASSVMLCPHGGSVSAITSNQRAKADADYVLRQSDTFTISGCTNTAQQHPCVSVQWTSSALRCRADGDAALTTDSVGLCLAADSSPQGSVNIASAQTRAAGQ